MLETILSIIGKNWAFIAVAFILGLVGEVIKPVIIGDDKEAAKKVGWKAVFIRTMPIHPVIIGGLLGLVLVSTLPEMIATGGVVGSVLYFAAAGALSTWLYSTLKSLAPKATKALQKKLSDTVSRGTGSSRETKENSE